MLLIHLSLFLFELTQCVTQNAVVNCAKKQIGKPYANFAAGPNSFDSSGLAYYCHNKAIPRSSIDQSKKGIAVSKDNVKPGDLMFWNTSGSGVSHTSICIGDGYMIHAPQPGQKVKKVMYRGTGYWEPRFVTAKRYWS